MDEGIYQSGFGFGRQWALRDATPEQLLTVKEFGDGKAWVAYQHDPGLEFTRIIDPVKSDFMGIKARPPASFVSGFINGAQSIRSSSQKHHIAV